MAKSVTSMMASVHPLPATSCSTSATEAPHPFEVQDDEPPLLPEEEAPCGRSDGHGDSDEGLANSWNSSMEGLLEDVETLLHRHQQEVKRLVRCHLQFATKKGHVDRQGLQLTSTAGIEATSARAEATETVVPTPRRVRNGSKALKRGKTQSISTANANTSTLNDVASEKAAKPSTAEECLFDTARQNLLNNQSWLQRVTRSQRYEWASGALILCNAAFIGAQTELAAQQAQDSGLHGVQYAEMEPVGMIITSAVFTFLFAIELLARWISEGLFGFFRTADIGWCVFDVFIVALSIVDTFFEVCALAQSDAQEATFLGSISMLRVLRVMRVVKLARVIRLMSFFRELRLMIYSILGSLKSLVWVTLVLGVTFYIFGIVFTSGTVSHVDAVRLWTDPASEGLRDNFGTLGSSFLTLYLAMTGGRGWGEYYVFLADVPVQYRLLFLTFVTFTILAALNIVTGVFVDSAMQASNNNRQVIITEEMDAKRQFLKDLRDLFHEMDEDGDGTITAAEFGHRLSDERVIAYFNALKLDVTDTRTLFQILDTDKSDEVNVLEFLEGCYRLQGEARSIDTKIIRMQLQWMVEQFHTLLPSSKSPQ